MPSFDRSTTISQDGFESGSRSRGADVQAIAKEVAQLQERFVTVLTHTKVFFQKKMLWYRLKFELSTLMKCQHLLQEERDRIANAIDADEMFDILKFHWNYVDYAFLKHLIEKIGTTQLQKEMEGYIAELEKFEKKMSVQDFDSAVQDQRDLPTHFRSVTITLSKNPAEYSMHDVRQLKNEVVNQSTLHECAVYLQAVRCNSVEITLAYPPEAHAELVAVFSESFMETHSITAIPKRRRLEGRNSVPENPGTPPQHSPANKGMCRAR